MDADHFDTLTRSLTTTGSRRRALAVTLVGVLSPLGHDRAEAKKKKTCPPCKKRKQGKCKKKLPNGTACAGGTCQSGSCIAAITPPLPPPTCTDGVKNGTETGVDCGGPTCPRCAVGQGCLSRNDCASAICSGGICQTCTAGAVCAAGGVCSCVLPPNAATTTCVALPAPAPVAGSCPGSCATGKICVGTGGMVLCTDPCTAA